MFGHDWEPATAKIVAKRYKEESGYTGVWEYVADVTTHMGATFRATLKQPTMMSHVARLSEGDVVQAFADAKRQEATFDRTDPRVSGKGTRTAKDAFDDALAQPRGSPPPGTD